MEASKHGRSGIGAAIAKTLAAEGADVTITHEKSSESAAEVVSVTKVKGRRGVAIQVDSADASAVQASVDKAVVELAGLDILERATLPRLSTCLRPDEGIIVASGKSARNADSSLHRIGSR